MGIIQCQNGHLYSQKKHTQCPYCKVGIETIFEDWHIEELIGEGSIGKVYKISSKSQGGSVVNALKHISFPLTIQEHKYAFLDGLSTEDLRKYYEKRISDCEKEIKLMMALKENINIVAIHEYKIIYKQSIGADIYIRMEFLQCLTDYMMEGQTSFKIRDVAKLGIDIGNALCACHEKGIIHRDIKPDNIFVHAGRTFKLGDFSASTDLNNTNNQTLKGTYTYMAPEINIHENYDFRADEYSLGIVLYRLLNDNRPPFFPKYPQPISPDDRMKALKKRLSGEALPAPSFQMEPLCQIVTKMCSFSPSDRYVTIEAVVNELQDDKILKSGIDVSANWNRRLFDAPETLARISDDESKTDTHVLRCDDYKTYAIGSYESTALMSSLGIEVNDIPKVDISKIPQEAQAYNMLMNQFKSLDFEYQKAVSVIEEIRFQSENRKTATIVITIAEIITGIGVGNIPSSMFVGLSTLFAGLLMTGLGLFLTFKTRKK